MGTTSIYLDTESEEIIKRLKEQDPNFSLSDYVRTILFNNKTERSIKTTRERDKEFEQQYIRTKQEEARVKAELELLEAEAKRQSFLREAERLEREEKEYSKKTESELRLETSKNWILALYDVSEALALMYAKDFHEKYAGSIDIASYMKMKHHKVKKPEDIDSNTICDAKIKRLYEFLERNGLKEEFDILHKQGKVTLLSYCREKGCKE